jgi:hypothetical protein
MADAEQYLAVLKASYDYEPQSDDEVKIVEDQILLLLERTDDEYVLARMHMNLLLIRCSAGGK